MCSNRQMVLHGGSSPVPTTAVATVTVCLVFRPLRLTTSFSPGATSPPRRMRPPQQGGRAPKASDRRFTPPRAVA
jgi:hypothetical protein